MGARKIVRRAFLIGSVAVAGGVAFGAWRLLTPRDNPLAEGLAPGEAALTPWIRITPEGITLITPHVDLGQGAAAMQALLIAEEMDLDPGQYDTDPGQPDPAYYNAALARDLAPFLAHDDGLAARATRATLSGAAKLLGIQGTGGSSSVPDSFDKLRRAGAVARETLKLAASARSGVPVGDLTTASGAVVLPGGETIAYTALAGEAAALAPVQDVALRDPAQWRLIGQPTRRLDIVAKSTGTQVYGIDLAMPGMVHAAINLNPRLGGALLSHDATAALALPGVRDVLPVTGGVAILADNTWAAMRGAAAVVCDWGPAPYPAEMEGHWAEVAASFTDDRLDGTWRDEGGIDDALAGATLIEAEYRAPYVAHQPLEPLNAIVLVGEDAVDVWVSHQLPGFAVAKVAAITGRDAGTVRFHQQFAGGSFGHRLEFENLSLCAEIAAARPGVPIKLTYSREQDFARDFPRQIGMARGRGAVANGQVTALDLQIATVSATDSQAQRLGQAAPPLADGQIAAGAWNQPLALPHVRVRTYKVPPLAPVSSWRSVGASSQGFFASAWLDELIHAAGADPLAERLRLCNHDLSRKVLEAVGEMSDWGRDPGPGRGRGLAFVTSFGVPVAEVVDVTVTDAGIRIDDVFVALEVGRVVDPVNFENQVQGGVVWGLGHAMNCQITYADGMAQQTNYHAHAGMRLHQCPRIAVRGLENGSAVRGVGEPPVPPAAPALAGAIFAATGQRLREMPFDRFVTFA